MTGSKAPAAAPAGPRRGRPPDPSRDAAIMEAALDGIAEAGYDRLSMEDIAARAGAGRATLYRRWTSKAQLVTDAVLAWRDRAGPVQAPDTGSLDGDLRALADTAPDLDQAAQQRIAVIVGLLSAANRDPDLKAALAGTVFERPRQLLQAVFQRAAGRGEIPPDAPLNLACDIMLGLSTLYALQGSAPPQALVRDTLLDVIAPLLKKPGPSRSKDT
jgi:AcrR family transcriptional regulator